MGKHGVALMQAQDEAVAAPRTACIELSIVIPTFNERENVPVLLAKLEDALEGVEWEAIFVDDHSPDGTSDVVRGLARINRRVRSIERVGRRGLSSACIEGMMASAAPYIAVMDADLQHDETALPKMLRLIEADGLDVVIGSRRCVNGSMGEFARNRVRLSNLGTKMSRLICRCDVTDPMSGFFLVEARFFRGVAPQLTGSGFKILLDVLGSSRVRPRTGEVPYTFRTRQLGESKLDFSVGLEYLFLVVDKLIGRWVPTRFVLFALVGALGVLVHLAVLAPLYLYRGHFERAQTLATVVAMTFNFLLNNVVTFRDRRLRGRRLAWGLVSFYSACSLGAVINVGFANLLVRHRVPWYLAGGAGTAISSVWNYGVNTVLTWRRSRR
jgi:dolichol-phosphate mannosyltransferase